MRRQVPWVVEVTGNDIETLRESRRTCTGAAGPGEHIVTAAYGSDGPLVLLSSSDGGARGRTDTITACWEGNALDVARVHSRDLRRGPASKARWRDIAVLGGSVWIAAGLDGLWRIRLANLHPYQGFWSPIVAAQNACRVPAPVARAFTRVVPLDEQTLAVVVEQESAHDLWICGTDIDHSTRRTPHRQRIS